MASTVGAFEAQLPSGFLLQVIDDYYESPESVRSFALECDFELPFTGAWPGLHSLQSHPSAKEVFFDLARRTGQRGTPNWEEVERSRRFWGRPSAGVFALLLAGQQDTPHAHKRTGRWAGVCYLSREADCVGRDGVRFFRHRPTGLFSCAGLTRAELERVRADGTNPDAWDQVGAVPLAFNRMVLFDGQYFHAASNGFGTDLPTGRLVQLFAIDFLT